MQDNPSYIALTDLKIPLTSYENVALTATNWLCLVLLFDLCITAIFMFLFSTAIIITFTQQN
jgi:hypothetical protein